MNKFLFILISYMFLNGCAQSVAVLGPAISIAKTGSVQHALVSQTVNSGIKHQTGKNISDHMVDSIESKPLDCEVTSSNELHGVFFDDYRNIDCHLR
ncbi:hypothetical protein N9324_04245 [Candidatus Pelagibacter sp.]|nr:hypothetical protein [Candidatus Pelagibacter sp.]